MNKSKNLNQRNDAIFAKYASAVSIALLLLGLAFLVAANLFSRGPNEAGLFDDPAFYKSILEIVGATFIQAGLITFVIDRLSLQEFLTNRLPRALFEDEYLDRVSSSERERIIDEAVRMQLGGAEEIKGKVANARKSLLTALRTPERNPYELKVRLLKSEDSREDVSALPKDDSMGPFEETLCISAEYAYTCTPNLVNESIEINGTGIIHAVNDTLPETTSLARTYRKDQTIAQNKQMLAKWVRLNIRTVLEVTDKDGTTAYPDQWVVLDKDVDLYPSDDGRLWLRFVVRCQHKAKPGDEVRVYYAYRWFVDNTDFFSWTASANTRNFRFELIGFEEFDTSPIPTPAIVSFEQTQPVDAQLEVELREDLISCVGLIHTNTTYTFVWRKRESTLTRLD